MGRGETGTLGTIINKEAQGAGYFRIPAGPYSENKFLDDMAADHITEYGHQYNAANPPDAPFSVIQHDIDEKKQVERHPEQGFPGMGKKPVERGMAPVIVDMPDQP